MSDERDEKQDVPVLPRSSPWISREGDVVHPDAPAGSGGLGYFKTAGSPGSEGNDPFGARHPRSPSVRLEDLTGDEKAETASRAKTDEVGTTMSEYVKNHPGATGH